MSRLRRTLGRPIGALVLVAIATVALAGWKSVSSPTPAAPIRAAFYYPWFPEAWNQQGQNPYTSYTPSRGRYSTDVATVRAQIADMQYGRISVGIASWFGPGTTTDSHWPALMSAAEGTGFGWAPYYEREGISNPSPRKIADDLHYLWMRYGASNSTDSGLLSVSGKGMVVFVYNADDATTKKGCKTVKRWVRARRLLQTRHNESVFIDLKVFPGYASCPGAASIEGWHQYGPSSANHDFAAAPGAGAYSISPGYWRSGAPYGTGPFLARDRARWQASIAGMRASGAAWQLITTYNEWGEGTAIESSSGCRSPAPVGTYCDWSGGGTVSDFLTDLHNAPLA